MIRIISKQDGFRRCGVSHPSTAVDHPDDKFTDEELEILDREPMLAVSLVDEKAATKKAKDK